MLLKFKLKVLSILAYLACFLCVEVNAQVVGKILYVKGQVYLISNKKEVTLKKGDKLNEGKTIKVGDKSLAVIEFGQSYRSKIKLTANSQMHISQEKSHNEKSKIFRTNIVLKSGGAVIDFVNKKLRDFNDRKQILNVSMNNVALGVRGTRFFTYEDKKSSYLNVDTGVVSMKSNLSKNLVDVKKSNGSLLNKKGGVIKPRKMKWKSKINWKFKGNMSQPKELFLSMSESYNTYKNEQEFIFKEYTKNNDKKKKRWNSSNNDLKKRMFGN